MFSPASRRHPYPGPRPIQSLAGRTYAHDVVIDRGQIRKRRKGASKRHRNTYGHTPLSAEEKIPWRCRRLVIGTGAAGGLTGHGRGPG